MPSKRRILPIALAALLAACSTVRDNDARIDARVGEAERILSAEPGPAVAFDTVRDSPEPYVGGSVHERTNGDPLPASLQSGPPVTVNMLRPSNILAVAQKITATAGVPVRVDLDSGRERLQPVAAFEPGGTPASPIPAATPFQALPSSPAATLTAAAGGALAQQQIQREQTLRYTGPLPGLLDRVAQLYDLSWRNNAGTIVLYLYETRTFQIYNLPGKSDVQQQLSTEIEGSGDKTASNSPSTASQDIRRSATLDAWPEVTETIRGMTPEGSIVTASPSTSSVTVTATPNSLRRVADYVDGLNREMARQIVLDVDVLALDLDRLDAGSFSLEGALHDGGLALTGTGAGQSLAQFSGTVATIDGRLGGFDIRKSIVKALSRYGRVSTVTNQRLRTRNMQPVPFQDTNSQGYVRKTETTVDQHGNTVSTGEVDTVVSGFSASFLPRILSAGRLLLQSHIAITRLNRLEPPRGINIQVQTPNTTTRSLMQEAILASGQAVVMASYQEMRNDNQREGTGWFWNALFGGGGSGSESRTIVIMLVTPHIVASPLQTAIR